MTTDDFKRIRGIGAAVERRLHEAGILTFAQLAALPVQQVAALVGIRSAARVAKEKWIAQARRLAQLQARHRSFARLTRRRSGQRYATYTLELLLDDKNQARRTHIVYVQNGEEATWVGWDQTQLLAFIASKAGLRIRASKAQPEAVGSASEHAPQPVQPPTFTGELRLKRFVILSAETNTPTLILPSGQPVIAQLSIDLTALNTPGDLPLRLSATVYAKRLGTHNWLAVGTAVTPIVWTPAATATIQGTSLPPGTYRLEAHLILELAHQFSPSARIDARLEGGLLQIL
jgi:hypothetical protein